MKLNDLMPYTLEESLEKFVKCDSSGKILAKLYGCSHTASAYGPIKHLYRLADVYGEKNNGLDVHESREELYSKHIDVTHFGNGSFSNILEEEYSYVSIIIDRARVLGHSYYTEVLETIPKTKKEEILNFYTEEQKNNMSWADSDKASSKAYEDTVDRFFYKIPAIELTGYENMISMLGRMFKDLKNYAEFYLENQENLVSYEESEQLRPYIFYAFSGIFVPEIDEDRIKLIKNLSFPKKS